MNLSDFQKLNLPDNPGVYFFRDSVGGVLYIGKATSLRDRVRSYFSDDLIKTRGRLLVDMLAQAKTVTWQETDSVLEAFILETELIKEYHPKYNTKEKDNRSFNYVVFTKEDFPRVLVVRGRSLKLAGKSAKEQIEALGYQYTDVFGPYPHGAELREALKIIRKIFPYRDKCTPYTGPKIDAKKVELDESGATVKSSGGQYAKPCFNRTIGLCPGVCSGEISKSEYKNRIKELRMFFKGKKMSIVKDLEKSMHDLAKKQMFEKAGEIKKTLYSLAHIKDISMIKRDMEPLSNDLEKADATNGDDRLVGSARSARIEAYDIAHMSGKNMVGAMVVMIDGEFENDQYRIFNIKGYDKANDLGALEEVLVRRFAHKEWLYPDTIVIDGGPVHLKRAKNVIDDIFRKISKDFIKKSCIKKPEIVSVVKDDKHKAKEVLRQSRKTYVSNDLAVKINAECHRFVIKHFRKRQESQIFK
jgi:excinuclease ABC subunit C